MDNSMDSATDTPVDNVTNIVSLADKREEARLNKEKEELKKLPQALADYLDMRKNQIDSITATRTLIKEFEEKKLCFSKNLQLTGPQIDVYLSYKMGIMVAVDNMRYNDEKVKAVYPSANLPTFE